MSLKIGKTETPAEERHPLAKAGDDWCKGKTEGILIGTFPYTPIAGGLAEVEVHWINDPDSVGLRYPDNSRITPSRGYLSFRDPKIGGKYDDLRKQWMQMHDPDRFKKEYGPKPSGLSIGKSTLKIGGSKLVFKPKQDEAKPTLKIGVQEKPKGLVFKKPGGLKITGKR